MGADIPPGALPWLIGPVLRLGAPREPGSSAL